MKLIIPILFLASVVVAMSSEDPFDSEAHRTQAAVLKLLEIQDEKELSVAIEQGIAEHGPNFISQKFYWIEDHLRGAFKLLAMEKEEWKKFSQLFLNYEQLKESTPSEKWIGAVLNGEPLEGVDSFLRAEGKYSYRIDEIWMNRNRDKIVVFYDQRPVAHLGHSWGHLLLLKHNGSWVIARDFTEGTVIGL
ncbi:hypothetical protein SH580_03945 [Coraliomargarita algicola]|uniref:Lipoprotein n=1 Tax=Coraliomargarita algicola TaxID=3092156 RepID=A0ABZ0RLA8_9BACT|nr:hypothetical protein [Coraliomargarita sp. J2-16]WPJ96857.1 hypothetical protein SH580_03945 [Coraliomargarita sp. J2-16]